MYKFFAVALTVLVLLFLSACVTAPLLKAEKPGRSLTDDSGYFTLVFTKKIDPISFGSRLVYAVIIQKETGRHYYVPFGGGNELRLISAASGIYRIDDFVYMAGVEAVKGADSSKKPDGIIYGSPQISGTTLVRASYPKNYKAEFTVNTGRITYIGDYSWDSQFSFTEPGVVITRNFTSDTSVYYKIKDLYPNMPESMQVFSITKEQPTATP